MSRDQAAVGTELPRHTAKFHLDKLVEEGLLDTELRRLTGRRGPGAGRPTKGARTARLRSHCPRASTAWPARSWPGLSRRPPATVRLFSRRCSARSRTPGTGLVPSSAGATRAPRPPSSRTSPPCSACTDTNLASSTACSRSETGPSTHWPASTPPWCAE
ncbi:hypothetical protein ACQP04_28940 [Pseudonocardia halophobica]|uniref:hypothetical protein n=1 Tax=Pseudonocardia halophobica TaxID=29401 RepID=UPI003D8E8AC7